GVRSAPKKLQENAMFPRPLGLALLVSTPLAIFGATSAHADLNVGDYCPAYGVDIGRRCSSIFAERAACTLCVAQHCSLQAEVEAFFELFTPMRMAQCYVDCAAAGTPFCAPLPSVQEVINPGAVLGASVAIGGGYILARWLPSGSTRLASFAGAVVGL